MDTCWNCNRPLNTVEEIARGSCEICTCEGMATEWAKILNEFLEENRAKGEASVKPLPRLSCVPLYVEVRTYETILVFENEMEAEAAFEAWSDVYDKMLMRIGTFAGPYNALVFPADSNIW